MGKWHYAHRTAADAAYKVPCCGFLDRGLARSSGPGIDAEGVVDLPQGGFGAVALRMCRARPVGAADVAVTRCLAVEAVAQGVPAAVDVLLAQRGTQHLHELVGDDGDEQVPFGARLPAAVGRRPKLCSSVLNGPAYSDCLPPAKQGSYRTPTGHAGTQGAPGHAVAVASFAAKG